MRLERLLTRSHVYWGCHIRAVRILRSWPKTETRPLIGENHDRIGFYVYEGTVRIRNLKVYTSKAIRAQELRLEGEGFE